MKQARRRVRSTAAVALTACLWLCASRGFCQDSIAAGGVTADYSRDIRSILSDKCYTCHGPDEKQRATSLRLDRRESAIALRDSGRAAIVPGDIAQSELYLRIVSADDAFRMPPVDSGKILTPAEISVLKGWIEGGAPWQEHWAFQKPRRSEIPAVRQTGAVALNPIDHFVLQRLEQEGLLQSSEADRTTLIRRLTLDLTGLPPTLEAIDAFLSDSSPEAVEKLVDRLLNSPHYGEHMARYWLDMARYGDTHGLFLDNERSLWLYRDWVISAFNANLPFDQFTIEQLAGDLLPDPTLEQRVATGFNRCNVSTSEPGSIDEESRIRNAVDRVETTAKVWLGLTAGCAVCHDHKYDPLTQTEFYQLLAYFSNSADNPLDGNALLPPPVVQVPTTEQARRSADLSGRITALENNIREQVVAVEYREPEEDSRAAADAQPAAKTSDALPGQAAVREQPDGTVQGDPAADVSAGQPPGHFLSQREWERVEKSRDSSSLPADLLLILRLAAEERNEQQRRQLRDYFVEHAYAGAGATFEPLHIELTALRKASDELSCQIPATMVMADRPGVPTDVFVLTRGEYDKPDRNRRVLPGVPAVLPPLSADAPPNRLALARWLCAPEHPLTARVTVNRFWQQFFGSGIVTTSEDFGAQGQWPSHPELLDWLAMDFVEGGWDVKRTIRQIVLSATYRQDSRVSPELARHDPENRLLARGPRFRADAEVIRDVALAASGLLTEQLGGRSVRPYQPPGIWELVAHTTSNTGKYSRDSGEALYRRSLYTFWKRTAPFPGMLMFDAPTRDTCTVRRPRTNTPLQALALMNDEQYVEAARMLAVRILRQGGVTPAERLSCGFRMVTARRPDAAELAVLSGVLDRVRERFRQDGTAAEKLVAVGEMPRNAEFETIELAAYTMVASLLLNLDEAITRE